jgi:hypothetical protein
MTDSDDSILKAEIDQITKRIDNIMKKLETVVPVKQEEPGHTQIDGNPS